MRPLTRTVPTLLAVLVTAVAALAAPYVSPKGFQVTPPAGWHRLNTGGLGAEAIFTAPPSHQFTANVNLVTTPAPPSAAVSPSALFPQLQAQINTAYPRQFGHYQRLSEGMTKVAGAPAMQLVATYQMGTPAHTVQVHQVYALRSGQFHIFTLTSLPADFARNNAAFGAMLRTVHWTK